MNFKYPILFFACLICSISFAQDNNLTISGKITDSLSKSINNVTIIAKPLQDQHKFKYAISNNEGLFKLKLVKDITYKLNISHIGYQTIQKKVFFSENKSDFNIRLNAKNESLDEVVINYKYEPIKKSKDTITYNLKSFTNGNEFKLEDVLAKLPGVKIENDVIKIQGKAVTKLLVEGKLFFDGSTKLAIENIPADVMAKIEIISDYKESELLRNLADNEDLALNVVLKEDKKDFAFGDLEAGIGLDEFYRLHPALFKYNPKSNFSFIADINNFNNSSISFRDLSRLVGGSSNLFRKNNTATNLMTFASNNQERFKSTTRFSALNFQNEINDRLSVSSYAIYSNNNIVNKSLSLREYLGDESISEKRNDFSNTDNSSALFNVKLDYNPKNSQKWLYNINYINNDSYLEKKSLSSSQNSNEFSTDIDSRNSSFSHNLEGYFRLNDKHTIGVALQHSITNVRSTDYWSSNATFLQEFLPILEADDYQLRQNNDLTSQQLSVLIKDYWITSKFFHLYYNLGLDYKNSKIKNDISQIFNDNTSVSFLEIGNNNILTLSDYYTGFGVKTQLGKFEFTLEAKPHYYKFKRSQIETNNLFVEPRLEANYKIDDDIDFDFGYNFNNRYLNDFSYLENLKLVGFNSVLQGNPNLEDVRSHNFNLYYSNYKHMDKYFIDASLDYSLNNPSENNSIIQSGINRLNMPVILRLPEENLSFNTNYGLIFNKSSLEFDFFLEWLKTNQVINANVDALESYEYSLSSKLLFELNQNAQLNFSYKHSSVQLNTGGNSKSTENIISLTFDTKLFNNFIFKTDFSTNFVNDFTGNSQNYTLQNLYLGYSKPNTKFTYSLNFRNIYNNGVIIRNNFANNIILSKQVFTLPRTFLFELKYKF